MSILRIAVLAMAVGGVQRPQPRQPRAALSLAVTDTVEVTRQISGGLRLELRGDRTGWEVAVIASAEPRGENLLYHSREWHGPYPTQFFAWAEAEHYFGNATRELPVRGYPWVVRLWCDSCRTAGSGDTARFTAGTLRIEWHPAAKPPTGRPRAVDVDSAISHSYRK